MKHDRLFSIDEANTLVPQIELVMERMQRIGIKIREEIEGLLKERGEEEFPDLSTQELLRLRPSLAPLFEDMAQAVQDIEQHGCLFKDLELGLVDFPAQVGDEEIYLCWQYGEKEIGYFHRQTHGFSGRRPIADQSAKPRYKH
jgi:hypothetical protein